MIAMKIGGEEAENCDMKCSSVIVFQELRWLRCVEPAFIAEGLQPNDNCSHWKIMGKIVFC